MEETKLIKRLPYLKSKGDYLQELKHLHQEIGIAIETDTLIVDDLKMMTRMDEIICILEYMKILEAAEQNEKKGVKKLKKYRL